MKFKKILATALASIMAVSLAACGGNGDVDGKVTLKIGVPNGDTLTPFSIIEEFKAANPDINVELDEAPWGDFATKLTTQIAGGTAPDVFIHDSGATASFGANGAAMDLSEKIAADINADDYISALYAAKDADGKVWGVPHGLNVVGLYYNETLFDEAGLSYPDETWTMQDVLDAAKKLTPPADATGASPVYGFGLQYSITVGWLPFIMSTGGAPLNEAKTESNFNDPKVLEGVKLMNEFVEAGVTPPVAWYSTQGGLESAFANGKIAMAFMNSAAMKVINTNGGDALKYNVTAMPLGADGSRDTVYVPNCWIINKASAPEKQEAAWKWLKFYLSEETQLKLAEEIRGGFPIHKKAIEACQKVETKPADRALMLKYLDTTGTTLWENPSWSEWREKMDKACLEMVEGRMEPEQVVETVHKEVSEVLAD
ncbi:MAG: sugar ABC transporter substrate-binding protein [Eubacteriales bacterium]|nr:sugar ABC transporter substrate-binding protein [Eubacteriales bacterium]